MQIDHIQLQRRANKTYLYCGKSGHFIANCFKEEFQSVGKWGCLVEIEPCPLDPQAPKKAPDKPCPMKIKLARLTSSGPCFTFPVTIRISARTISTMVLIDFGSEGNFFDIDFAQMHGLPFHSKMDPVAANTIDGSPISSGSITTEIRHMSIQIGDHLEQVALDIIKSAHSPLVLGLPWLELHDPTIIWSKRQLFL